MKRYDVVIHDGCGMPYRGDEELGLGGSEFAVIRLSKALAARGLKVLVRNNLPEFESWTFNSVTFESHRTNITVEAPVLILQRYSQLPNNVGFDRLIIQVHDLPDARLIHRVDKLFNGTTTLVCNSEWQRSLYPKHWQARVIPCLLPETDLGSVSLHRPGHFIYASAAMKGLKETIEMWRGMGLDQVPDLSLHVIASWDPGARPAKQSNIVMHDQLNHNGLARLIASCEGMMFVNTFPETFCVTAAMAERLGTRVHILCKNGFGALREVLADSPYVTDNEMLFRHFFKEEFGKQPVQLKALKDYSVDAGVKRWLEIIKEPQS